MMDWQDHGEHMTTGGWVLMVFGMVILVAVVAAVIVWIVSQQRKPDVATRPGVSARDTLDHRLVSGEVTPEQYDELRKRLDPPAPGASPPASSP
jgi:uncharacterized membrane protein